MVPRPSLPKLLSLPLPAPVRRAHNRVATTVRRASIGAMTRASNVPVLRPFAELGFRSLFDSLAHDWERIRADPTYRAGFDEALAALPRGFKPRRVLDVACGTGIAASFLLERWPGLNVIGTDIAPRMVDLARDLVPDARFEVASVHHLPFEDGEFDLVTALDGMLDLPELLRVLHRKGRMLIVYSRGGTTPIARPVEDLARELEALGAVADAHIDGEAHVLVVRHGR